MPERTPSRSSIAALALLVPLLSFFLPSPAAAPVPLRKIGEMELSLLGVSARVDPLAPAVRIVVRAGGGGLSAVGLARFLGLFSQVKGERPASVFIVSAAPSARDQATSPNVNGSRGVPATADVTIEAPLETSPALGTVRPRVGSFEIRSWPSREPDRAPPPLRPLSAKDPRQRRVDPAVSNLAVGCAA